MSFKEPPCIRLVIEGEGPGRSRHLLLHNLCLPVFCLNLLLFDLRWVVEEVCPAGGRCPANRPRPACDLIVGKQTVYRMWSGSRHPRRGHVRCGVLLGETHPDCCSDILLPMSLNVNAIGLNRWIWFGTPNTHDSGG